MREIQPLCLLPTPEFVNTHALPGPAQHDGYVEFAPPSDQAGDTRSDILGQIARQMRFGLPVGFTCGKPQGHLLLLAIIKDADAPYALILKLSGGDNSGPGIVALARSPSTTRSPTIFVVITGGPSVGKTTIVSMLHARGFPVVAEQATKLIKEGQILPWVDRDAFQKEVLRRQLVVEAPYVGSDEVVFLDRGMFDGEAYYRCDGLPIPETFAGLPTSRYGLALVIEALPFFDNNGVRFEDLEFTKKITPVIEHCYTSRGIRARRIPALSPAQRVDFVLDIVYRELPVARPLPVAPLVPSFAMAT